MAFLQKIKEYIYSVYHQSFTSCEVSTYLTIAILATTFPFLGITTLVVTAIAFRYNFNVPFVILLTYSLEPLRFFVFLPLSNLGGYILGLSNTPQITLQGLGEIIDAGFLESIGFIAEQLSFAVVGWLLVVVPLSYPFFFLVKKIIAYTIPKTKDCIDTAVASPRID